VLVRGLTDERDGRLLPKAPGLAKAQRDFLARRGSTGGGGGGGGRWDDDDFGGQAMLVSGSGGVGRPATLVDDDVAIASAAASSSSSSASSGEAASAEDLVKEQRLYATRALERLWAAPCKVPPTEAGAGAAAAGSGSPNPNPCRAWVRDERLQLAFSFPTVSCTTVGDLPACALYNGGCLVNLLCEYLANTQLCLSLFFFERLTAALCQASEGSLAFSTPARLRNVTAAWLGQRPRGAPRFRPTLTETEDCFGEGAKGGGAKGGGLGFGRDSKGGGGVGIGSDSIGDGIDAVHTFFAEHTTPFRAWCSFLVGMWLFLLLFEPVDPFLMPLTPSNLRLRSATCSAAGKTRSTGAWSTASTAGSTTTWASTRRREALRRARRRGACGAAAWPGAA